MLNLCNVNIDCDATDFLVDSRSLLTCKVILLDIYIKLTLKEFDVDFKSSSIKEENIKLV